MNTDRSVSLTDRWGAQTEEGVTLERFAALYDDLDSEDEEHSVVDISDDQERYVEFSLTTATLGNAESGDDVGSLALVDRGEAIAIASEFLSGAFNSLRQRPWA
ncbi:hypothetical protein [Psychromicrobium xiongbiense]|uniref:hypothetical protein n=1 Tax=Psychromicrobium xiongbiense TaxID=3051184 RepID=UPI002554976B|nr:hypothetical protein [Psychromicrobium sp. YIM S02556]